MNGPIEIPNKSSFKINEVCALTDVKSYVLRFWESEFPEIAPLLSTAGLKLYEHKDIEAILLIKKLLFDDKLTIEIAKGELKRLIPRESLDLDSDLDEDTFSTGYEKSDQRPQTKRVLLESDIKKLVHAKNKLKAILFLSKAIHEKNNWV